MMINGYARPGATRCQLTLLALAVVALANCGRAPSASRHVLTSVNQVRQLSAARAGVPAPVDIKGILTFFDGISTCVVQDSTGGIRVTLTPGQIPPAAGWRVEVAGVASSVGLAPAVSDARVTALEPAALPAPVSVAPSQFGEVQHQYQRVELSGVVRSVGSERAGLITLEIRVGAATL